MIVRNLFKYSCHPASFSKRLVTTASWGPKMTLLNCLVYGDTPAVNRVFLVKVRKSGTVSMLKKAIKGKKQCRFSGIDAGQLALWKVSLPLDSKGLENLVLDDNFTKGAQKLHPEKKLSRYFTDEPAEEHLHIIVNPPSAPPTGML